MFENAYYIQNKHISVYLKILLFFILFIMIYISFFEIPLTIYHEGVVVNDGDTLYIEILTLSTEEFTNKYMKIKIKDNYYSYSINKIESVNMNANIYYLVRISINKDLMLNEKIQFTLYLGETTVLKNIIKNIEKGITYGQIR